MDGGGLFFRDTWVEVDLDCIAENVKQTRKLLPKDVAIIAVVKANGYGHGAVQVAKTALEAGASYLAVAFMDEALAIRNEGIDAPILVLGATRTEDINIAAENQITLTVFQEEWLKRAQEQLKENVKITLHLKIDTGMGRIGIKSRSNLEAIEKLAADDPRIDLEGVFTHFATADETDLSYYYMQLNRFNEMISAFKNKPTMIHASNSAAALRNAGSYFSGIRLGISMYGLSPSLEMANNLPFPLCEAFSLRTEIIHVKKLMPGEKVSYGGTYKAENEEWIGTLPIGYADGWIRKLQGQEILINGMRAPIVGRICMDQCMVKLPNKVETGTVVTLIGKDGQEMISVNEIAKKLETINYEITCMISNRVPRLYKKSGVTVAIGNAIL